jgi:peroxiredoxin
VEWAGEFDYRRFNFERAEIDMIGLATTLASANAARKAAAHLQFSFLSDPKCKLMAAMGMGTLAKDKGKVGVFAIDAERTLLAHSVGKSDTVLDQLDRQMDVFMAGLDEEG